MDDMQKAETGAAGEYNPVSDYDRGYKDGYDAHYKGIARGMAFTPHPPSPEDVARMERGQAVHFVVQHHLASPDADATAVIQEAELLYRYVTKGEVPADKFEDSVLADTPVSVHFDRD